MLDGIECIFDNKTVLFKKLKKEQYVTNFDEFLKKNSHFFEDMLKEIEESTDKSSRAKDIGENFVIVIHNHFMNAKGKINGAIQADLNLFMIYYGFPAILNIEHEDNTLLIDSICSAWHRDFKDSNISYTSYEKLCETFNSKKIFGIF